MSEENNYAIWYFLKKCHSQGLLYKGRDSVPWCPRCGTAISQHEILTEEYKELTHRSVFVKFRVMACLPSLASAELCKGRPEKIYFLGWTTTPWTLPGNTALAVHPDLAYAIVKYQGEKFIILKSKLSILYLDLMIGIQYRIQN